MSQMPLLQYKDPRYTYLFNMTLDDINVEITEIRTTRPETSNHALNKNNRKFKNPYSP